MPAFSNLLRNRYKSAQISVQMLFLGLYLAESQRSLRDSTPKSLKLTLLLLLRLCQCFPLRYSASPRETAFESVVYISQSRRDRREIQPQKALSSLWFYS